MGPARWHSSIPHHGNDGGIRIPGQRFDWDALDARSSQGEPAQRNVTGMDLLAWVVLVLLTFCPLLAFTIAFLLSR